MTTSRLSCPPARRLAVATLIVALFAAAGAVGGRMVAASAQGPAADPNVTVNPVMYQGLRYRSVGPHRGGRVTAISGVRQQPCTFYLGATGGGVWKTTDCGVVWTWGGVAGRRELGCARGQRRARDAPASRRGRRRSESRRARARNEGTGAQ